jgi:hypothetical protein
MFLGGFLLCVVVDVNFVQRDVAVRREWRKHEVLPGHRRDERGWGQQVRDRLHEHEPLRDQHGNREVHGEDVYEPDIDEDGDYTVRVGRVLLGQGKNVTERRRMHLGDVHEFVRERSIEPHMHYSMWKSVS